MKATSLSILKKFFIYLLLLSGVFFSCGKDDGRTCTTCSQEQTANFEVCEEPNGTASVNGQLTGVSYDVYIAGLEAEGAVCGN